MITVLCVDDHAIVREGIELVLSREADMSLIGSVATGEEAIEFFRTQVPDVTLMDMQLATISGVEAIRSIRQTHPDAKFIVLTMYDSEEFVHRGLSAGARTYLLKDTITVDLVRVIREVYAGDSPLPFEVEATLQTRKSHQQLTSREIEVVQLVAEGMRNKEIAAALDISEETVITHLKHIFSKLEVNDRTAALSAAVRRGIVQIR